MTYVFIPDHQRKSVDGFCDNCLKNTEQLMGLCHIRGSIRLGYWCTECESIVATEPNTMSDIYSLVQKIARHLGIA